MVTLGQVSEVTQASSELVRTAGQYGPETFIAVIVIACAAAVIVLWVLKVVIPNSQAKMEIEKEAARSARENAAQLSQAVSACLPVISSTHETVKSTGLKVSSTDTNVQKIAAVVRVGIVAIEKIAQNAKVDISHELSRIHGILDDAQ